jgi:hypothetical protein
MFSPLKSLYSVEQEGDSEFLIGKDVEEIGRNLFQDTFGAFVWRN